MTKLSIIIPCYNCEETLEAAVASVYQQESVIPFDVTMVDDGSADNTCKVMKRLAARYPDVRLFRHASNRGGGATRNTAVANSDGDIIFCLDSDDMLGADFLKNMTRFWLEKRCDGVGISKSIKFKGTNTNNVAYVNEFRGPGEQVAFESLLDGTQCSLYSTFLITRAAFFRIGGYPTDHGFDTQGMAFRFLCNGLTAYTCPDTVYHHRVGFHRSYYIREDRAGRAHWNMFKIVEEFLYLFRDEVKAKVLEHDLFPSQAQPALLDMLRSLEKEEGIYVEGYSELLRMGRDRVASTLKDSPNRYEQYWLGAYMQSQGRHAEALEYFTKAAQSGFVHRILYCRLLEAAVQLSGNPIPVKISVRDLNYYVNDPARLADSAAPPLSRYQGFENWLLRHRTLRPLGSSLRCSRVFMRRLRPSR